MTTNNKQASQLLVYDLVENVLRYSDNPGESGSYITEQIREIVGVRSVAIFSNTEFENDRLIAACPARKIEIWKTPEVAHFVEVVSQFNSSQIITPGSEASKILEPLGIGTSFVIPLSIGAAKIGMIVLLDLFDLKGTEVILKAFESVAPVFSLILKNSVLYKNMEELVKVRTAELAVSEATHRTLVANLPDVVMRFDKEFRHLFVSDNVTSISRFKPHELIGKTHQELGFSEDQCELWQGVFRKVFETGSPLETEFTLELEKEKRTFNWRIIPEKNGEGLVSSVLTLSRDITEHRKAEMKNLMLQDQLHHSQKMEAIGQLAGGVAHDFNNALGAIIGATELLSEEGLPRETQKEYLSLILTASERASELTKKLLLFSRKGNKVSDTVDCVKIVEEAVSLLSHTIHKNITIGTHNNSKNCFVLGDSSMIQNALINMGINSSQAMPSGGQLTFTLENIYLDEIYCEASPFEIKPGEYLEIAIRDSGCGMTPEVQSHIFEPFFTTKAAGKGTGLGMAAVYGTIVDHGGAITVYSELGTGSVFHIYLPVTLGHSNSEHPSENIVEGSGLLLVIDDEESIRITASAMLRSLGYDVILASNGLEGVKIIQENKNPIDLILLDMIMPVMGGLEAFIKIKELNPKVPIVVSSGFSKGEELKELKNRGVDGFLSKPFRKGELSQVVAKIKRGV